MTAEEPAALRSSIVKGRQMQSHVEIELKFTVADDFAFGAVTLPDAVRLEDGRDLTLEAEYFDTADRRLFARGITLRRRRGGDDEGWHLKLPRSAGEREELAEPLGEEDAPPVALQRLVAVHVRREPFVPIARIATRRTVRRVVGDGGVVLAELADDDVTAEAFTGGEVELSTWRELELELVDGDRQLLETLSKRLQAAGAHRSSDASKLGRALGDHSRGADRDSAGVDGSAGEVVRAYLEQQINKLKAADPGVRLDAEDQLHQLRVACRRLRTALKTFRPLFDREQTDPIRDELRWIATSLGDARDTEVLHGRLVDELEDDGSGGDPAHSRIDADLGKQYRTARKQVLRHLDSARYFRLLDRLDALVENPPFTADASAAASKRIPRLVRKAFRAVRREHDAAARASSDEERVIALHEVRKAAKRARYAGEAAAPSFGKDATRFAAAFEKLQDLLGEHRDSFVARQTLGEMAPRAHAAGEDTFTIGVLAGREEERAAAVLRRYDAAWDAASARKLRRWLT